MKLFYCRLFAIFLSFFSTYNISSFAQSSHALPFPFIKEDSYHAAGVLPYAKDKDNNIWLLVGQDSTKHNQASDFGGLKDHEDRDNRMITAAREAAEEIMFLFDSDEDFEHILRLRNRFWYSFDLKKVKQCNTYRFFKDQIKNADISITHNGYIMHFVQIPFDQSLPEIFAQRKMKYAYKLPFCWNEKTRLHWIKLDDAMNAIAASKDQYSVYLQTAAGKIHLFSPFVRSLLKYGQSRYSSDKIDFF